MSKKLQEINSMLIIKITLLIMFIFMGVQCPSGGSGDSGDSGDSGGGSTPTPSSAGMCTNGTATSSTTDDATFCASCNDGFALINNSCISVSTRATTSDLLITQFQGGTADATDAPMTQWRVASAGMYDTIMAGCRKADGSAEMISGAPGCQSYVIEIYNGTGSAVALSNYALLYSNNGDAWGSGDNFCGDLQNLSAQIRFTPTSGSAVESIVYDLSSNYCHRLLLSETSLANGSTHVVSPVQYNGLNIIPNQLWERFIYDGNDGIGLARSLSSYSGSLSECPADSESVVFRASAGSEEAWCVIDVFGYPYSTSSNYTDPGTSWEISGLNGEDNRVNTFTRKLSVLSPTVDWNASRGCTSGCASTDAVTAAASSQWDSEAGYVYTNVGNGRTSTNIGICFNGTPTPSTTDDQAFCASCNSGYHLRNNLCRSFTGEFTRVGTTASGFGVGEGFPRGLAASGTTLYMVGSIKDNLYTVDIMTGAATQIGANSALGTTSPQAIAFHSVLGATATLYMVDGDTDALYTVDTITGVATRVAPAIEEFGVDESGPTGLASVGGVLYMTGSTANALYTLDTDDGTAARVGTAPNFGVGEGAPRGLAAIDDVLYMVGFTNDALYWLDTTTGIATRVGTAGGVGLSGQPEGLTSIGDTLYLVNSDSSAGTVEDVLYRSTLPTN